MKIAYFNCVETNAGWGAEHFTVSAIEKLGHKAHSIDFRKYRYRLTSKIAQVKDCDVVLVQKGDGVPPLLMNAFKVPKFFWACDILGTRPGMALSDQEPVYDKSQYRHLSSGMYDHVFVRTPNCVETVVSRGWIARERCTILLSAFDEELHKPNPEIKKDIGVLFIGSMSGRRKELIEKARRLCDIQALSAYGAGMSQLMNRAKIVINIHSGTLPDTETRVFEALGCGVFFLTERLSSENPFSEADLVQFDTLDEMAEKIKYYLEHEDERTAIAAHGHETALRGHSYLLRTREMLDVMEKYDGTEKEMCKISLKGKMNLAGYSVIEPFLYTGLLAARKAKSVLKRK